MLQGDLLAPFLFIIVIDYVSRRSVGDFGYLTHKGNNQDNSWRAVRSTTRIPGYKVNELAFADDIALLENDFTQAQRQLDKLENEAKKVVIEINVQWQQMRLNQSSNLSPTGCEIWILTETLTETRHLCENMLPYNARYKTIQRPRDKPKPIQTYWQSTTSRDDPQNLSSQVTVSCYVIISSIMSTKDDISQSNS